jgi:hypothetical protein
MMIDGKAIDTNTLSIANIDRRDYPDFCDAYFDAAKFTDGTPLTESQIDTLNIQYAEDINAIIHDGALYA